MKLLMCDKVIRCYKNQKGDRISPIASLYFSKEMLTS